MEIVVIIICVIAAVCFFALFAGSQNAQRRIEEELKYYSNDLHEAYRENLKLRQEKEKAVRACRVYRENINRLYGNLINLNDTYESNEENLKKAIEQVIYLTGQLEAYRKIYGELKEKEN